MHLFDQDNHRWVRFRQSEGTVQPEAWVAADEQDGDWQSITLPTQGLLLWDETEKASAVYFIEAGQLHRVSYCEDGQYHAALNIAAMAHKKADAENKVQERGGQCHEIQGVLVAFLPAVESFSNGEWGLAANIALAQRVTHTAPQIRARVNADKLPARPDKDNWLIQRQAPPHSSSTVFKETLDASLKDYAWRVEQLVYEWLLNLKRDSPSRDYYLTVLQTLIVDEQPSSGHNLTAHWPSIVSARLFIAHLNSQHFHEEWDANITPLKEYALHCMAAEYRQVAGVTALPFDYSKDNIPEPEAAVTVSDPTMQEALRIYNAYINDALELEETIKFYHHLATDRADRPMQSLYAYLVRWLALHDDAAEARVKHKLRLDILKTITRFGAPTPEQCNEIADCQQRETLSETLQPWYDTLEALLDERLALALLKSEHAERLKELSGWQIMWIAGQYEAFALALLKPENAEALKKLDPRQIGWIAEQYKAFALALLEPRNTTTLASLNSTIIVAIAKRYEIFALALLEIKHANKLDSQHICEIATKHKAFALALLKPENAEALKKLGPRQLRRIEEKHEAFAQGLLNLESATVLAQLNPEVIVDRAEKYENFALALLKPEHAEVLKKLGGWQIEEIAEQYEAFALALLKPEHAETLKILDVTYIMRVAKQHEAFALALLKPQHAKILKNLNTWDISQIAEVHAAFLPALLESQNLESSVLVTLAKESESLALALLKPEHAETLKKLSGRQIAEIATQHEAFALALLKPEHAETLKILDGTYIMRVATQHEAFALALLEPQHAEALKKLGSWQIAQIAEVHAAVLPALLESQNLESSVLVTLAKESESLALALLKLKHAEVLKNSWQITEIATQHEAFRTAMNNPQHPVPIRSRQTLFGQPEPAPLQSKTKQTVRTAGIPGLGQSASGS